MSSNSIVFDRAVDYYDETRGFPPGVEAQVAELFEQAGRLTRASRVLEVGIGTGRIALPLAGHVHSIMGVDLSRAMMTRLRAKQGDQPDQRIYLAEGDITRLPLAAQRFDAAVAVHIFHLVPEWRRALDEVVRVLRPGGILLYGRSERMNDLPGLSEALRVARSSGTAHAVGAREPEARDYLRLARWREIGEPLFYHFKVERTPLQLLSQVERRVWSHLWRLSDGEHAAVVKAAKDAIAAHYPDPSAPISMASFFEIHVFAPPEA